MKRFARVRTLAFLIVGAGCGVCFSMAEARQEPPQPQDWTPVNPGQGHFRIPQPGLIHSLVVDATAIPQLFNLGVIGGEYQMHFDLKRTAGEGGVAIAFPVGTESAVLLLDCHQEAGTLCGIDWVKGVPLTSQENPTARKGRVLENQKLCQITLTVRRGHVLVDLDGQKIVDANLGPSDVGGSHLLYPPSPADVGIKLFDGKFVVTRYDARLLPPGGSHNPEQLPAEGVRQILAPGPAEDFPAHVVRIENLMTIQAERGILLDFRAPLTFECWYRSANDASDWFMLLDGRMKWELRKEGAGTKRPQLMVGAGSGGVFGSIGVWDTKWHHIAASSDGYYTNIYFDGQFVTRSLCAYFLRDRERHPLRFGMRHNSGSKISGFHGEVRDFRISNIDRYPRTKSFAPPAVLGRDEHVVCKLDLRDGVVAFRTNGEGLGDVSVLDGVVNVVKMER